MTSQRVIDIDHSDGTCQHYTLSTTTNKSRFWGPCPDKCFLTRERVQDTSVLDSYVKRSFNDLTLLPLRLLYATKDLETPGWWVSTISTSKSVDDTSTPMMFRSSSLSLPLSFSYGVFTENESKSLKRTYLYGV